MSELWLHLFTKWCLLAISQEIKFNWWYQKGHNRSFYISLGTHHCTTVYVNGSSLCFGQDARKVQNSLSVWNIFMMVNCTYVHLWSHVFSPQIKTPKVYRKKNWTIGYSYLKYADLPTRFPLFFHFRFGILKVATSGLLSIVTS